MKNNLRGLRAEHEWSQADLASRLDVSRQTVNAVETGKYDPSLPLAFKIARLFARHIEDIFEPDERQGPAADPSAVAARGGALRGPSGASSA
jgi:putative transcriptional regulator